jgi:two-component SAPR family response regulator
VNCFGELAVRVRARPSSPHSPTGNDADQEITAQLTRQDTRLLACLAVHPHGITTASLADMLWPGSTHRDSGQRLRTALAHLRTVLREATDLPDAAFATHRSGRYHLAAHSSDPHIWVDYTTFDQAVHTARTHTGQLRIDAWHKLATLYSGTLLDGIDLDWPELSTRQQSAHRSATTALANLAEHYEHSDPAQAIDLLRTLLTHDPGAERPAELLITLYVRGGNPRAADRAYARLAEQLALAGRRPPTSLTEALPTKSP